MLKIFIGKEKYKIGIMIILLACACIFIYIFHNVIKIGAFFTHLFYIPIILASIWWKKKGLIVPVFLSILLITSHIFFRGNIVTINDYLRASMFITIGVVAAILSERIWKANKMLQQKTYELIKRNNEIRERTNKIAEVNQFVKMKPLGKLSAGIAHEISQPLMGISMGIERILFGVIDNDIKTEYIKDKCNNLLEYVHRIKQIIKKIKLFSREQKK